jgi:hypothetical protein
MPIDKNLIPTGELKPVINTPFDFKHIDEKISDKKRLEGSIMAGDLPGLDHVFKIAGSNPDELKPC